MKFKLVKKLEEAKGTKSFFWQPEKSINYLPGQYFYWTLPKLAYPDERGPTRDFTLSSSPTEGPLLRVTTRIRAQSGFKRTLDELPIGSYIEGEGPNGTFIIDEAEKGPHVLIAGGIGITPFRSMIKYAVDKNLAARMFLLYSNSLPEEITFRKELENWSKDLPSLKLAMTVTHPEVVSSKSESKWKGLSGRIDEPLLKKLTENWKLKIENSTYWLCGPPTMVAAMEKLLSKLKLPASHVRSDKFTGY